MPYAPVSPATSPTFVPSPSSHRTTESRPLRHHSRSQSSDALIPSPSTSFIYVQPASPVPEDRATHAHHQHHHSTHHSTHHGSAVAGPSSGITQNKPKRAKLFGFTPADASSDGPSSQEGSEAQEEEPESQSEQPIPPTSSIVAPTPQRPIVSTSFSFGESSVPLVPIPFRPGHLKSSSDLPSSSNASHAKNIKAAFPHRKTPMVRKKSGELVRSSLKALATIEDEPASRRVQARSEPATPTCPKYVHFDKQLEHVKHFLAQQRPAAVSRSGSPVETETEDEPEAFPFPAMASAQAGELLLKLPNFPRTMDRERDAYVESLEIAQDGKSLRGVVRVKNLSFEKWVAVRFTLDGWQTVSEVSAEHLESMGPMSDRFVFSIRLQDMLTRIEEKTMYVAVRYTVGGREIWDNNGGANYRVEFAKKAAPKPSGLSHAITAASSSTKRQTWSVTGSNAGQQDDRMADLRRELDRLVQDDQDPSPLHANTRAFTEGSPSAFSNRYDFGNSLKMTSPRSTTHSLQPGSPPKPYATTLVNGMPATVFPEPPRSPLPRTQPLLPDFGASFGKAPTYPPYSPRAHFPSSQHRPPSPPAEHDMASIYNAYKPYLPVAEPSPRSRHHSFPGPTGTNPHQLPHSHGSGIPPHYAPLLPPSFRAHRRNDSPFASPGASPGISPVPSPAMSPQSSSPQRSRSPPLYPTTSPEEELWSPASSLDTLSTTASPESEGKSVPESPSSETVGRGSGPSDFSSFLDRYCFHTSSVPSSLGLSGPAEGYLPSVADFSAPRRPSGTPSSTSTPCGAFFAGSATSSVNGGSGASTPNREETLEGFGGAGFGGRGPPAIVG